MDNTRKGILVFLLFVVLFISLILIIRAPIRQVFEYDLDEGVDLMASLLVAKGFSFYKEIWYEHPPLVPVILSYWFKLFGPSVWHGRILILIFSLIFLWAFYQTIKNLWGSFCAFTAVVFLILSTLFLRLHISVMLCTPARALAMLSIYFITLYKKSYSKRSLALSGIFMALSLHSKLIMLFLVPFIALEILYAKWLSSKHKKPDFFYPLFLWLGSFLSVYLIIIIFFHLNFPLITQQLFQPHLKQITAPGHNFSIIWRMILTDYDIALLALMGIILLIRQKKRQLFLPVLWLGTALIILMIWRPIFDHYYLLVSIPMCWLAAISFSQFFAGIRNKKIPQINKPKRVDIFLRWITTALIIITIARLPLKCYKTGQSIGIGDEGRATSGEYAVVNLLWKHKEHTHWIFTDRPIFAFCADILVPPELLIISKKRNFVSLDAQNYCINKLRKYKPELILLEDFKHFGPKVLSYIERNYINIYQGKIPSTNIELYLRKDIVDREKL